MTETDLTTFLTAQTVTVAAVFLAGFGAVFGVSLVRTAIVKHSAKLKRNV